MLVHHLNCVSSCPLGVRARPRFVSHCLLVEVSGSLVLVDTGYGLRDVREPGTRLSRALLALHRPQLREDLTAIRQIEHMGFSPRDVRDVVLTHLDSDHAGGLDDFPWARVHLLGAERDAADAQASGLDRMRYRPQQWGTRASWLAYEPSPGETWMGLPDVRRLDGLPPEILLVPLFGHTRGHCGVAVRQRSGRWILHAGDAYYSHEEMHVAAPRCSIGLRLFQRLMEQDRVARLASQRALRLLRERHLDEVEVICSHDVGEFEHASGRPADLPSPRVRVTREGHAIIDEGSLDAAPPDPIAVRFPEPVIRPSRAP